MLTGNTITKPSLWNSRPNSCEMIFFVIGRLTAYVNGVHTLGTAAQKNSNNVPLIGMGIGIPNHISIS